MCVIPAFMRYCRPRSSQGSIAGASPSFVLFLHSARCMRACSRNSRCRRRWRRDLDCSRGISTALDSGGSTRTGREARRWTTLARSKCVVASIPVREASGQRELGCEERRKRKKTRRLTQRQRRRSFARQVRHSRLTLSSIGSLGRRAKEKGRS